MAKLEGVLEVAIERPCVQVHVPVDCGPMTVTVTVTPKPCRPTTPIMTVGPVSNQS